MSPIEIVAPWSKIGVHVVPELTVLNSPPEAVATYTIAGLPGMPAMEVIRPPIDDGPIFLHSRRSNSAESKSAARIAAVVRAKPDNRRRNMIRSDATRLA